MSRPARKKRQSQTMSNCTFGKHEWFMKAGKIHNPDLPGSFATSMGAAFTLTRGRPNWLKKRIVSTSFAKAAISCASLSSAPISSPSSLNRRGAANWMSSSMGSETSESGVPRLRFNTQCFRSGRRAMAFAMVSGSLSFSPVATACAHISSCPARTFSVANRPRPRPSTKPMRTGPTKGSAPNGYRTVVSSLRAAATPSGLRSGLLSLTR
mmetsp:Transcript_52420/g.170161  ORF Transcript_52420/g.170161 Transcript_52420/m.170161 type:complete len:210 (+) Transcript_52420:1567-2196(+)